MNIKSIILFTILFTACSPSKKTYYNCLFDVVEEKLWIQNNDFEFEIEAPFHPKNKISGKYIISLDTLIFNPGISQNEIKIEHCQTSQTQLNENQIKLTNQNNKPLHGVDIIINGKHMSSNASGVIKDIGEFKNQYELYIPTINRTIINPSQTKRKTIRINCDLNKGNRLNIQLKIPDKFKLHFETETKLVKVKDQLFYINQNGERMNLGFNKLSITDETK